MNESLIPTGLRATLPRSGLWKESPTIRELEAESRGVQEWLSAENYLSGSEGIEESHKSG